MFQRRQGESRFSKFTPKKVYNIDYLQNDDIKSRSKIFLINSIIFCLLSPSRAHVSRLIPDKTIRNHSHFLHTKYEDRGGVTVGVETLTMELLSRRRWTLILDQMSNKVNDCPPWNVSLVLAFHKHNSLPLGADESLHLLWLKISMLLFKYYLTWVE